MHHSPRPGRRLGRLAGLLVLGSLAAACTSSPVEDAGAEESADRTTTTSEPDRILHLSGPEVAAVNAEQLDSVRVEVVLDNPDDGFDLDDVRILLDGDDVTSTAELTRDRLVWEPGSLPDGERTITVASATADPQVDRADSVDDERAQPAASETAGPAASETGTAPGLETLREWTLIVDTVPPEIELVSPDGALVADQPVLVAGTTEPGATVDVGEASAVADEQGTFELELDTPGDGVLVVTATDQAGNASRDENNFAIVPSRAHTGEVRSVHVSFCAWATPSLRDPVLELIEDGTITAVQLDLKDESGKIGHDTDVALAATMGADQPDCRVDLEAAVAQLHALDVPVIGRIVAFADPVLASWAWDNGERDWVIQTAGGEKFTGSYAGFSNFANDEVVTYNLDLAEEAAAAGVDHILWDYLRKPDGAVENFTFVGLRGSPNDAITDFTRKADERLAPYGVQHGASVYGVSADRPDEVAQDIPALAEHLDYVAPMIYPSHWASGEYGVADPLNQPYDMVTATLEVWLDATDGTRARVVPWLEDSNWPIRLGYPDRTSYVREQIRGTYDRDIAEWMLWDSSVRYTAEGMLQPDQ